MRVVLLATLLIALPLSIVPVATAQPCEVPGCQVVDAAFCTAGKVMTGDMDGKWWVVECLTGTA